MGKRTEYYKKYKRSQRYRDKIRCLEHYGNKCACCGIQQYEFMTIDHMNGSGRKHREQIKGKYDSIWGFLRRNGFPEGYRILCFNCNSARGAFGYCPCNGKKYTEYRDVKKDQETLSDTYKVSWEDKTGSIPKTRRVQ